MTRPSTAQGGIRRHARVPQTRTRRSSDSGSASVEAVIGVPAFLLLVGLLVLGGRIAIAGQAVQAAAADAARAASIARTQSAALTDATTAARSSLTAQHLDCATTQVRVNTRAFDAPAGTPGDVSATVTCTLQLKKLGLPGLTGTETMSATMSSPLDTYRGR